MHLPVRRALGAALLVPSTLAWSVEPPPPTADGPIVVNAPASEPALTAPGAVAAEVALDLVPGGADVVHADDYLRGRAVTLRDMLQGSPGVYVQPRQGSEESRLSIRGSGIQRTFHLRGILLLQDGQPINQADGGGDFQAVDPGVLDHVEVFRGANALHHGAGTLGGAIDFITPTGHSASPLRARLEGGSFGFVKGTVTSGLVRGPLDGFLALSAYQQDGHRDHSRQENQRVFANLGWRLAEPLENRLYLSYVDSDSELAGALTKDQLEDDPTQANAGSVLRDSKRDFPLYRVADRLSWVSGSERVDLGLGFARKELFHPLAFALIEQDSDDWSANARVTSAADWAGRGNRVALGVNGYFGETDSRQYAYAEAGGDAKGALASDALQTARTLEVFGELRHEVVEHWWAVASAQGTIAQREFDDRFLANGDQSGERTWRAINPKLGVLFQTGPQLQVYANVSRSFEPPTFAEYIQRDTSGFTRPQQDLAAQSAWTAEVGTRGANAAWAWDATLYYAMVRDEYLSYEVAPGLTQTLNADDTVHAGIELGLETRLAGDLAVAGDRLVLAQTYTYGRFRFDDDALRGDARIPGLPEHAWRGELRWEHPAGWYAGPLVEYQSGWPVDFAGTLDADASLLLGARAGYRPAHGLALFVEARNLLDETYAATTGIANPATPAAGQSLFNPGDGLAVFGGLEWSH